MRGSRRNFCFTSKREDRPPIAAASSIGSASTLVAGFFVILIFALHTRVSCPDTAFEWSIWSLFVVVAVSGVVGSILNRAIPSRLERIGERLEAGQIAGATADLSDQAFRVAMDSVRGCGTLALSDLYATTLMGHFRGPKNGLAHITNSRRPLQHLLFEIDSLRPQFERGGHDALDRMTPLIEEKDRIDFQCVHERVLVAWLSVHLPATYAFILLSMLHVLSVYAFRSGVAEMLALTPQALAYWAAVLALGIAAIGIVTAVDDNGLIPGPIAPAHSTLTDKCSSCHTNIEDGRLGWLHGLVRYADPTKDAKACLACHTMGEHATRAHGLGVKDLEAVLERQDANDGDLSVAARLQKVLFPQGAPVTSEVFCATCHKAHRPEDGKLSAGLDGRCHSCHKVQFEHFSKDHPGFGDYPYRRRARIVFDRADHFSKRFPEMREKKPDLKIPKRCADCHTSTADKRHADRRHMGVKPFAETCTGCHLSQIVGDERATDPKGVALLALPEIDLETLKEKKVDIGSWPEDSEAELTPLMKLLLGREQESRALLDAVGRLDLVV